MHNHYVHSATVTAKELIRTKRQNQQMSARGLSLATGHCSSYVSKFEAGTIEPSLRGFARLAAALNLSAFEVWTIVMCEAGL